MTDTSEHQPEQPAPKKKQRRARRARAAAPKPETASEFAGMTSQFCPTACTEKRCVISTVGICKHPYKAGDADCGPITVANRIKAKKYLEHLRIDAEK